MVLVGSAKEWFIFIASACCLLFMQAVATAQLAERQVYRLGTAPTEGVAHPLGVTLSALIKLRLLPVASIDLDATNTDGSKNNADQLRSADLDFGILNSFDAYHAARGTGPFTGSDADSSLRFVTNLWTSAYHFVVKSDAAPSGTFQDFLDLGDRPIALGAEGSDLENQARALFAALDIDIDEAYQRASLNSEAAAQAFLDGDIDGFLLKDDRQGADLAAFLEKAGDRAAVLTISADQIEAMEGRNATAWARILIPANTLPGQTEEQVTIGVRNLLIADERIADDAVYQITMTIFDNLPFVKEMHPSATSISLTTALEQLSLPVHSGAANYYREVGLTLPEPEPIRVSTLSQAPFLNRYSSAQEARSSLANKSFTVLGGPEGLTTTRMISELATSLAATDIRVVGMTTPEPIENIADVLYARGVDSAIIPLNILNYANRENIYPDILRNIVYMTELFTEEVHLVTLGDIKTLDDLVDRPVNLGPSGSTSEFTASLLLDQLNLPVEPTYDDHRTALARLLKGEIAAAFIISGKPVPILSEISTNAGLHLLGLPTLEGDDYRPATLSASDYPNLVPSDENVQTFSLRTMLLGYNWRPDNQRFDILSRFINLFFDQLPSLQEEEAPYHTKWREVDPYLDIQGWTRSPTVEGWIQNQAPATGTPSDTGG